MEISEQNRFQSIFSEKGMTLIEIMVVLIIIGLTMTIVATSVFKRLEQAKVETTKTQIKALAQPLGLYRQDVGFYPSTAQGLEALIEKPTVGKIPDNWDGSYIESKKTPADAWGKPFEYSCEDGRNYTLISRGADGEPGGEGPDADISSDDL